MGDGVRKSKKKIGNTKLASHLTGKLCQVLVGSDTASFQSLVGDLFALAGHKVAEKGEHGRFHDFLPMSKIRSLASGIPRQKRDFGYGLFLQKLAPPGTNSGFLG